MKRFALALALGILVGGVSLLHPFPKAALAAERIVTLGTAGVTGVYYPAGGAICRFVNRGRKEHGTRCVVESTGGSINNLESLRSGELDMGIVQSDWLYHAYEGSEIFKDQGANKKLRVLFSLHAEPFTVIARKESGIKNINQLKGKRVNIGNPGSGMRATMEELMRLKGWNENTFSIAAEIKTTDQAQALCSNKIDAMIYAVGHPNGAVRQVAALCPVTLVNVSQDDIENMLKNYPFYARVEIPAGMYANNPEAVQTFGVKAVLAVQDDLDEEIVYQFVKSVFDNLDNFKTLHPVFATLDQNQMIHAADAIAPRHPGAERYFRERGFIQ